MTAAAAASEKTTEAVKRYAESDASGDVPSGKKRKSNPPLSSRELEQRMESRLMEHGVITEAVFNEYASSTATSITDQKQPIPSASIPSPSVSSSSSSSSAAAAASAGTLPPTTAADVPLKPTPFPDPDRCFRYSSATPDDEKALKDYIWCSICADVAYEPIAFPCTDGHVYCKRCITGWVATATKKGLITCPNCRHGASGTFVADLASGSPSVRYETSPATAILFRKVVAGYKIICAYGNGFGCTWTGELRHWADHESKCPHAPVKCAFCNVVYRRRDSDTHECPTRPIPCEWCALKIAGTEMEVHRYSACQSRPLVCTAECGWKGRWNERLAHHEVCPVETVTCPVYGCHARYMRKHSANHHASAADKHVASLTARITHLNNALELAHAEVVTLTHQAVERVREVERARQHGGAASAAAAAAAGRGGERGRCSNGFAYNFYSGGSYCHACHTYPAAHRCRGACDHIHCELCRHK